MGSGGRALCALVVGTAMANVAHAQEAAPRARGVRIPLEFRFASVTYSTLHVDTLAAARGLEIGRTSAYGLQYRQRVTPVWSQVWALEYAGRRNAIDAGVCSPGAVPCERAPRAFGYKDWAIRTTTVVTVAPRAWRRRVPWLTPFVGGGGGVHAIAEPRVSDPTRGRIPSTWFGETSYHVQTGAQMAIPHTRIAGSGVFRWWWIGWRGAGVGVGLSLLWFAVVARL